MILSYASVLTTQKSQIQIGLIISFSHFSFSFFALICVSEILIVDFFNLTKIPCCAINENSLKGEVKVNVFLNILIGYD